MAANYKAWVAEFVATFALVFFGTLSATISFVLIDADPASATLLVSLTHGLVIALMIYSIGHISGGHINPAVTIAMLATKRIGFVDSAGYIASQLLGGVAAAALHAAILPQGAAISFGLNQPGEAIGRDEGIAFVTEVLLTFFLLFVIFGTALHPAAPKGWAGSAIGMTIALDHLVGIPISGASMNPARTLGPALVSWNWTAHWVYWAGPIIGAVLAALAYNYLFIGRERP